jgi:nicotinate-nucleotide pyrophosphorylase (carboxylating)
MGAAARIDWKSFESVAELLIRAGLEEDSVHRDAATAALGELGDREVCCRVTAREEVVLAGWRALEMVYEVLGRAYASRRVEDGARVKAGTVLGQVEGCASVILHGERLALNLLSRMCGVATLTRRFVEAVSGTGVEILDTRKTTPAHRALQRYAVRVGGGVNHRFDLSEMAMLKDNHLAAAGGAENLDVLVRAVRARGSRVEVEVDGLDELQRTLPLLPDRILLDNMPPADLARAVEMAAKSSCYMEASGGVSLENVRRVAETGVDGISIGALTHSAPAADLGMDWEEDETPGS